MLLIPKGPNWVLYCEEDELEEEEECEKGSLPLLPICSSLDSKSMTNSNLLWGDLDNEGEAKKNQTQRNLTKKEGRKSNKPTIKEHHKLCHAFTTIFLGLARVETLFERRGEERRVVSLTCRVCFVIWF